MKRTPTVIKTKYRQVKLAETLGVSQPTISNWLNLSTKPTGLAREALHEKYPDLCKRIEEQWNQ